MASIAISVADLATLKAYLRQLFDDIGSSHLSEAIAASLGYRTHAALLAAAKSMADDPRIVLLDSARFRSRLTELGYDDDPEFDYDFLVPPPCGLIQTTPLSALSIEYTSESERAWRGLMVCTVNEALERRLLSLRPGDNRWLKPEEGTYFDYRLPNGMAATAYLRDAGFDEVEVKVAVNPKDLDALAFGDVDGEAGDAVAAGWLERRRGAWLQTREEAISCRADLVSVLAAFEVSPRGYGDKGAVIY
jgi:hypothetical protein